MTPRLTPEQIERARFLVGQGSYTCIVDRQTGADFEVDVDGRVVSFTGLLDELDALRAEAQALREALESVRAELQDEPGDDDRLARRLALAKVEAALAATREEPTT